MSLDIFFESGGAKPGNITKSNLNSKKSTHAQEADESIKSKNQTFEFCLLTDTCANISNTVRELRSAKRKLEKDFIVESCGGDKRRAKERERDTQFRRPN